MHFSRSDVILGNEVEHYYLENIVLTQFCFSLVLPFLIIILSYGFPSPLLPVFSNSSLLQIRSSFVSPQKRAGLPGISNKHRTTICHKARHKPLLITMAGQGNLEGGKGFQDQAKDSETCHHSHCKESQQNTKPHNHKYKPRTSLRPMQVCSVIVLSVTVKS